MFSILHVFLVDLIVGGSDKGGMIPKGTGMGGEVVGFGAQVGYNKKI